MDLIKGEIKRKVPLSRLELRALGIDKEEVDEVNFDSSEIINISSFEFDTAIVTLRNPPFENVEDFFLLVDTVELFKSKKIMDNIILKYLKEITEKGSLELSNNSPRELMKCLPILESNQLVEKEGNVLTITSKGTEVIKCGGLNKWEEKTAKSKLPVQEIYHNSTIIKGDKNQIIDQSHSSHSKANIQNTEPTITKNKFDFLKWLIPVLISSGILAFAYLNYVKPNTLPEKNVTETDTVQNPLTAEQKSSQKSKEEKGTLADKQDYKFKKKTFDIIDKNKSFVLPIFRELKKELKLDDYSIYGGNVEMPTENNLEGSIKYGIKNKYYEEEYIKLKLGCSVIKSNYVFSLNDTIYHKVSILDELDNTLIKNKMKSKIRSRLSDFLKLSEK